MYTRFSDELVLDAPVCCLPAPRELELRRGRPCADLLRLPIRDDWGRKSLSGGLKDGSQGDGHLLDLFQSSASSSASVFLLRRNSTDIARAVAPKNQGRGTAMTFEKGSAGVCGAIA
ncbi:hypothetical protein TNCV_1739471 [Trichonephila clavipes]|nr:hypothetical protein TNCV_1739471 [Trichonephila clavipes]